ncbi:MAG: hypothetical protein GY778_19280 [bacterium]|nr:hypothetical protein [bacterium]
MGLAVVIGLWTVAGCADLRRGNTVAFGGAHVRASDDSIPILALKTIVFYPARDLLTLDWLRRRVSGDEAWNAVGDGVADTSFFTNRAPTDRTPAAVARGPCTMPPPQPPFEGLVVNAANKTPGFTATDALGRSFRFKLDRIEYPELSTSAEIIGSRIFWALGYNVAPVFLVEIRGTGDARFDGRRAVAALYLNHVQGYFKFDWHRYRREVRGLRSACAWVNDTDRIGSNTLVRYADGRATHTLIDFNSSLGSWNGRPKEPWRGFRHEWNLAEFLAGVLSFGLVHAPYDPQQPIFSRAVGRFDARFDPLAWRGQLPNTAFDHLTAADARWAADRIAQLDRPHLTAIVAEARLTDPADADYLVETLMKRRQAVLRAAGMTGPNEP